MCYCGAHGRGSNYLWLRASLRQERGSQLSLRFPPRGPLGPAPLPWRTTERSLRGPRGSSMAIAYEVAASTPVGFKMKGLGTPLLRMCSCSRFIRVW